MPVRQNNLCSRQLMVGGQCGKIFFIPLWMSLGLLFTFDKPIMSQLLLLLSCFSRVRLCATHRRQPTRLPRPWDSPGKNTGVGCHFLLQCMKVKSESEVAQLSPTLSDPMDCSPPGSSIHGIFQAKEYCSGVPLPSPNYVSGTYK